MIKRPTSFDKLQTGCVIRYPYLWSREAARGETAGRKERPVAVAVRLPHSAGDMVVLLAISSQPPRSTTQAIEIPETEKSRAGLDRDIRLWIILDEYNSDMIGRSFHLVPDSLIGQFGEHFFDTVLQSLGSGIRTSQNVDRTR